MSSKEKKLGLFSLISIVISSMLGSGTFVLPVILKPYGYLSFFGWLISGFSAISLALVFSKLSYWFPKTGGPHIFVEEAFGKNWAFFTGWTYWLISWVSTTVVVISGVKYLASFFDFTCIYRILLMQIMVLISVAYFNLKGISYSGKVENFLTLIKIIPFIFLPILALSNFNFSNLEVSSSILNDFSIYKILGQISILTFWGFVGVESATAPADFVENPKKNIPNAIIFGTITVLIIYLLNTFSIMGFFSLENFPKTGTIYADVASKLFGGVFWEKLISLISAIVCLTTVNAWTLTSSQVSLGLANSGYFPKIFSNKNKNGVPYFGILVSSFGMLPLLFLTLNKNVASQVISIVDFSVTAFLFVYLICCLSFLKFCYKKNVSIINYFYGLTALFFCFWIIYETSFENLLISLIFIFSGFPFFFFIKN